MRAVRSCISSIIIFAVGLAIGLVVLGWWLFPVEWENGNMTTVNSAQQEDYLRAGIDSYTLNGDQNLAINRYESLGEFGPATLTSIQGNPGSQSPQDIQNYSLAVVGGDGSVVVPETTPVPDTATNLRRTISDPRMAAVLFLGLLLVVVLIAIFFVARRGRKAEEAAKAVEPPAGETPAAEATSVEGEAAATEEAAVSEEIPVSEEAPAPEQAEVAVEDELGGDGLGVAGLAAAGVVAAGVAAAVSDDEEPAAEILAVEEAADEAAPAAEDAAEGGAGMGAAAVAGLAAAALIASKGGEDEALEQEAAAEAPAEELLPEGEPLEGEGGLAAAGVAAAGIAAVAASDGEPAEEAAPVAEAAAAEWLPESEIAAPAAEEAIPDAETTVADEIAALYYSDVIYIEGVGPVYGQKLKEAGVRTPADLLTTGATRKGREDLAEKTGIPNKLILEWVNHVDLFRVKGIGQQYADLLEAAGVDTVPELAQRNAENLYQKLLEINEEKKLVRKAPVPTQVESWVAQAKTLHRIVTY